MRLSENQAAIFDWSNRCWLSRIREEAFFLLPPGSRGEDSRSRRTRRGPAGGEALATSRLVAPSQVVGLQPTGPLPQVGEAMRPRSEVGSLFVAASNADGGGANGLGRRRTSSDAMCV